MIDRRKPERRRFVVDEAKFTTQKTITYAVILLFALLAFWVFWQNDQSERSMVLQTVINLVIAAFSYWIGASKGAADARETLDKMIPPAAPLAPIVPSPAPTGTMQAADVKVEAQGDVTVTKDK